MEKVRLYFKSYQGKILIFALCVVVILAAAFFLQTNDSEGLPTESTSDFFTTSDSDNSHTTINSDIVTDENSNTGEYISQSENTENIEPSITEPSHVNNPTEKPTEALVTSTTTDKKPSVTISIRCDTILNNMDKLDKSKQAFVPSNGIILPPQKLEFSEGESVFDILKRETRKANIQMEFVETSIYNSVYIEGINNIYEFDCGSLSGWNFKVNGELSSYGSNQIKLKDGDVIEWLYTCDMGRDLE